MGLMDKVKAQASTLAQKTQETANAAQAKIDAAQASRKSDGMLRHLGLAYLAERTGRATAETSAAIDKLINDLVQHESQHNVNLVQQASAAQQAQMQTGPGEFLSSSQVASDPNVSGFPEQSGFPQPGGFPQQAPPAQTGFPGAAPPAFPPSAGFPEAAPPAFPPSAGFPEAAPPAPAFPPSAGFPEATPPPAFPPSTGFPEATPATSFPQTTPAGFGQPLTEPAQQPAEEDTGFPPPPPG